MVPTIVMSDKELNKQLKAKMIEQQLRTLEANKSRAQSVSIGMSGSGTTEMTMRGEDGAFLWNVYQPVQVIEFIHQLAASIGCHIHIQPRQDFASYRGWQEPDEEEKLHLNGFPPFAKTKIGHEKVGLIKQNENIPGLDKQVKVTEQENVAIKKAVDKPTTKRSRTTAK